MTSPTLNPVQQAAADVRNKMREAGGRIAATSSVAKTCELENPVDIADNVTLYGNTAVGAFSYINVGCVLYANSHLGRFCSVGRNVEMGLALHPVDHLSTHPFQCAKSLFMDLPDYAEVQRVPWRFHAPTRIGHDVWIGAKACIVSGVTVGTGAVIAAGAVVTKDVEPYTIVGGVPAKPIKKRFDDDTIAALLETQWWSLDMAHIKTLPFSDIQACIEKLRELRQRYPVLSGS